MSDSTPPSAPPPPPGQPPQYTATPFSPAEDKQYATLATFLNIIILIPGLIFWFGFGNRGPFIHAQAKNNLNWTIGVTGIYIVGQIVSAIIGQIPFIGWLIALLIGVVLWLLLLVNLIFSIIGGLRANQGQLYRYPFTIDWIK